MDRPLGRIAALDADPVPDAPPLAGSSLRTGADAALAAPLRLRVNGRERELRSLPSVRLSDCLRDELGLTGTKVGCHAGDCGACTVLLDGEAVCSCIVPLGQCAGREVVTVEALAQASPSSIEAALRRSFLEHGAAQCGICTPGMLMTAVDVLRRHPEPTLEQVLDGLGGVLCRCTGYRKIVEAVLAAAGVGAVTTEVCTIEQTAVGSAVGARVPRLDALAKVDGSASYGADRAPADACWLKILRSPHASASFEYGNLDAFVAAHPGLLGVLTARDIPYNRFAIFPDLRDQPAIAEGVVRMRGEAVLVLVGERETLEAIDLADAPVHFSPRVALEAPGEALAEGAAALHESHPDNVLCRGRVALGDVDAAIAEAAVAIDATMRTRHIEHAYIEPEAGYAQWSRSDDAVERVTVFACTQTPYLDRSELASMFALDPSQVRIVPSAVGGGFGGKLDISIQPLVVAAARKFARPARIVYTRPESMVSTTKRHPARMRATLAADADGRMLAYRFEGDFDTGAYASWGPTVANRVPIHASGPYRVEHVRALTRAVYTNGPIGGAFRGFGVPQSTLLNETLVDRLAERLGVDPLEYRFEHALRAGDRTCTGQRLQASAGLRACLDALRPAWREARARAHRFNAKAAGEHGDAADDSTTTAQSIEVADRGSSDPHRRYANAKRRGVGVACMWYGIGNTVIANPSSMQASLRADGRVVLYNGAVDIGQGTYTILPQILADALGVPLACIDQVCADTDLTLDAGKSSASRQTFVSGNAARLAGEDLRARLLALLGVDEPATLCIEGGVVSAARAGEAGSGARIDLRTLALDSRGDVLVGTGHFDPPTVPLDADGQGVPYATYGFAAQVAEVEVDVALGTVRVLAIHAAHDVGRAINPTQVEGQIHGGIAQGLGLALMEEYVTGRTDNLHDYLIPTAGDIPPIRVHLIEDAEPLGPRGAKGVGEPALVATAPAILNAIHHAVGVRMQEVPVTPDRLRAAIVEARAR
ncbi:MAG TPA: molybdopterin cofactor-binding domain-containing protein [Zeimonas sp.]